MLDPAAAPSPSAPIDPLSPRARRIGVAATFAANGALLATWVARIPVVQQKLHLSTGVLGLALLGTATGALLGMPLAGKLSSRIGSRWVVIAGLIIQCATLPLLAVCPNVYALALTLVVLGFGNGAIDVAMNTQAVSVERMHGRPIMPSFHALWNVGGVVGAGAASWTLSRHIGTFPHFLFAAIVFGAFGIIMAAWGMIPAALDEHVAERRAESAADEKPSRPSRLPAVLVALGVIGFCGMLVEGSMGDWEAIYLRQTLQQTTQFAAGGYACFSLVMGLGRFFGDYVAHRYGAVTLLRTCGILSAVSLAFAIAVPNPWLSVIGFAGVGAGLSIIVPIIFSAAGNMPGLPSASSIATVSTIGYCGFLVGPPVIGFVAEAIHLRGALALVAGVSLIMALLAPSAGAAKSPQPPG